MAPSIKGSVGSAVFVVVAGGVVWPPGGVYWAPVAEMLGDTATAVLVGSLAAALGIAFASLTFIRLESFIVGGVAGYLVAMASIEYTMAPESSVHYIWYGGLLVAATTGFAVCQLHTGRLHLPGMETR